MWPNILYIFAIILIIIILETDGHRFSYSEPNQVRWARHHGHCAGQTQSPISVYSRKTIQIHMPAVDMIGYHNVLPYPLKLMNNGHTATIVIPKLADKAMSKGEFMPYISGAKLPGEFEVEGIHFHWGFKNNRGAEHVINDVRYAMEMHIVHRNMKYVSLAEALDYADGVAVLGFFYNLDEDENICLNTICRYLDMIPEADNEVSLNVTFSLASLIHGVDIDKFYTYKGSLTTPPCSEAVTWVLYPDPIPLSQKQIHKFRQLSDNLDGALVDNFRELQPLGNRRIFMRMGNTQHTHIKRLMSEVDFRKWDWFN